MRKIVQIIRSEKIYLGLLIVIILFNILVAGQRDKSISQLSPETIAKLENISSTDALNTLLQKKWLFSAFIFFVFSFAFSFILGIVFLAKFITLRFFKKTEALPLINKPSICPWGIKDIVHMIILILFFTYCASFILAVLELIIKRELFILRLALLDLVVILVIGYFIKYVYKSSLRILGLKIKDALSALPWAVISYIAFIPIFVVVLISNMRIMNLLNYEPKVPPVFGFVLEGKNIFSLVLFMVLVGVIAPIVEELFFRGFLYNASKKYLGKTLSVAITTVLFALLHQELFQFAPIVFIGLLLIYVYEKTGSLWTAIMVHSIHNISTTYLVLLIKSLLLR